MTEDPETNPQVTTGCIVAGLLLLAIATWRMFSGPAAVAAAPEAPPPAAAPETSAAAVPVVQPEAAAPAPELKALAVEGSGFAVREEETEASAEDEAPAPAPAPAPVPALRTFYVEVEAPDGTRSTLSLSAADEDAARRVLRDFRGDPTIVNGPSLDATW